MRMFRIFRDLAWGTQLARRDLILRLKYDSMIVSGAMTNFQWSTVAGRETYSPFAFNLLVKSIHVIYGSLALPTKFTRQESFTPAGFQLEGAGVGDTAASQTYVGAPPGLPEGVHPAVLEQYFEPEPDATGTYWQEPEQMTPAGIGETTEGFDFT